MTAEPRFDIDFAYGRQGELWVESVRDALQNERAEVKTDRRYASTGNLYVEFECRKRAGWAKSGIATSEADVWVFVLGESGMAVVVRTDVLRDFCRMQAKNGRVREERDGSHPTKGVVFPLTSLLTYARDSAVA